MAPKPTKLLSKTKLRDAWRASRDSSTNAGRPGSDNVTALRFAANLDHNLGVLAKRLQKGIYGPAPLKAVFIPKPRSDKERMICIPTVADRVVQRAVVAYLVAKEKLPIYNSSSFGFIRGRGPAAAINAAIDFRRSHDWCLKTDIESFFDKIPRQYLKECVAKALGAHSLTPIISKVIDCEIRQSFLDRAKLEKYGIKMGLGVRQGMPLSPILSNLVLSKFDDQMERKGMKMVRYADDIVLFFKTKDEAKAGQQFVKAALKSIDLTIPELIDGSKTQLMGPSDPIDFLGREIVYVGAANDVVARVSQKQISKIVRKLEEEYSYQARIKAGSNFQDTVVEVSASISAYFGIYKDAHNFVSLDTALRGTSRKIISEIFFELLGEQALSKITIEGRKFLGMSHVNFGDPVDDLDETVPL
jgi:RNA-directed DNA polymerase